MSTELEPITQVISPATGEILTLDAPTEDLANWLLDVRDWEAQAREAKRAVMGVLLARMDKHASWTTTTDSGLKITGQSPAPVEEWDGTELRAALLHLVDEGVLDITAVDNAVETVVTYRPRKTGINQLRKLGGRVGQVIESLRHESERDRRITVTRT